MALDPLDIVASTADAALATDEDNRIVIWNKAAERLLGHSAAAVLGKSCHEILCGRDVFGNRFCDQSCALGRMARRHEPISRFEMEISKEGGSKLRVSISTVVVPGPKRSQLTIIHLLQPVQRGEKVDQLLRQLLRDSPAGSANETAQPGEDTSPHSLSARELEVLRLLADGSSTEEIADLLFISAATVRNHIQNILRKLDVHSKLEAVSLALRNRLI